MRTRAPVNTVPGEQTTDENTDVVFSADNGNAIQVSDLDAIDDQRTTLEVTLAVDHGTLTLSGTDGLTFTSRRRRHRHHDFHRLARPTSTRRWTA